jgi:uncharacterized Zn finger protein
MFYEWKPYVSVAERRKKAARQMAKLAKKGHPVSPVVIEGKIIAKTFWGKAWCENLEHYSDFSNRLPRGRTYARNGSVVDLQIAAGEVRAWVSGSSLYKVEVKVAGVSTARWSSIRKDCAGGIDSLVELLQGRLSKGVMERICKPKSGLFPEPAEIKFTCSCPDWASMCKHVAAVLYGIGARLDERPEHIFQLRKVDEKELVAKASRGLPLSKKGPAAEKVLATDGLAELFGLDMGSPEVEERAAAPRGRGRPSQAKKARGAAASHSPKEKRPRRVAPRGSARTRTDE